MTEVLTEAVAAAESEGVTEGQDVQDVQEPQEAVGQEAEQAQMSKSKERREQRKAELERAKAREAEANARLEAEVAKSNRILAAAEKLPEPKESDFDKYDDYLIARTAYASVKALNGQSVADIEAEIEQRRQEVARARSEQDQQLAENWRDHAAEAKGRYSDFEKVVYAAPITERVSRAILRTDAPADVAYRLALNPALARDISAMSDLEMGRALGRIEAGVSAPRPKTETGAPPPISPVTPSGTARRDPDKMSNAEWRASRSSGWKP